MTTTLDAIDTVWETLNSSSLKTEISGSIYKNRRAASSTKEDIVINSLPINNAQLQQGVLNVNVHVPNKSVKKNKVVDSTQPDYERMKELAAIAVDVLDDNWIGDHHFEVQQQVTVMDEATNDHYINIRLNFNSINLSN
jgi:hypothetical protein